MAAYAQQAHVVMTGRVHRMATRANDRGAVEGGFAMQGVTLHLQPTAAQKADLLQLLAQQQDPASANYHQWLTPEQYAERFGAAAADVEKLRAWLVAQGFTVENVARGRTFVTFRGTAGQVGTAFHTSIHRYSVNGAAHFANATDPAIPAEFAGVVAGISGLHDFHAKPRLKRPAYTVGGGHELAPDDIATIYDIAPMYTAGMHGEGQSIIVVGQSQIRAGDVAQFRTKFNLGTINLTQVLVKGRPNPGISPLDVDESHLDIEWAGAVARNANIVFVYSDDVWQSAYYAVDQKLGTVLTMSYGGCEMGDLLDLPIYQAAVQQANAEGITWLAASGDSGAGDCEDSGAATAQNGLAVDVPAAIPEVTAMGGTEFLEGKTNYWATTNSAGGGSALSYIPEQVWNDTALNGSLAGSGGGASIYFPRPVWQTGPGVPQDGARHVPDLALSSSADHDPYYYYSGGAGAVGGTSVAAPVMAGVIALLNQYLVAQGTIRQAGLGNVNPMLYKLAQTTTGIFHDVQTGSNNVPCVTGSPDCPGAAFGYSAGPGYDQATGWGSVDATNLIKGWATKPAVASAVVASIDQNPVYALAQPDKNGNRWVFQLTLNEEAGVGTTLTDLTIDGVSYAAQLGSLFGGTAIGAYGRVNATVGLANVAAPKSVTIGFAGLDGSGAAWNTQLTVPFNGVQVQLAVGGISNTASGQQVYAPGMVMSIYGTQLGNMLQVAGTVPLPQFLAGFQAAVNGVIAPIYFVSPNQVNVQIPYETLPGKATLVVGNPYANVSYPFTVAAAAPGIFMLADGSVNPSSSGARGQTVTMFVTGDGRLSPAGATGTTPNPRVTPKPAQAVSVTVGGVTAALAFVGVPSWSVGVTQINFTIPPSVALGVQPVVVTVGTTASPAAKITVTQ